MVTKQQELDSMFMEIAECFAKRSHCVSYKVAALAVFENRIIACGINGTAPNMTNCDSVFNKECFDRESHHKFSERYEIHAEQNLICFAAKHGIALENCTVYLTLFPCKHCLKLLSVLGVERIVYKDMYDIEEATIEDTLQYCTDMNLKINKLGE